LKNLSQKRKLKKKQQKNNIIKNAGSLLPVFFFGYSKIILFIRKYRGKDDTPHGKRNICVL